MVQEFPLLDVHHAELHTRYEDLVARFKALRTCLGVHKDHRFLCM